MSYCSRRSRNVQASNVKDTTIQSVEDILSQVIHDAAPGEVQAPETLLSSSCNQTDRDVKTMTHPTQGTTTEADDVGSNKRSRARRHSPSPSHPLAADPPRQLRSSLRYSLRSSSSQDSGFQQVHDVADEGVQHPALSSRHNNKAEDPAMTLPTEATTMEPNDVRSSQRNPSERQALTPSATQQHPPDSLESPGQHKAPKTSSCWVHDDDQPAEQGDSGAGHAKLSRWNDEIEFDEIEEVEMRGNSKFPLTALKNMVYVFSVVPPHPPLCVCVCFVGGGGVGVCVGFGKGLCLFPDLNRLGSIHLSI